jgi:hypothetical protein
MRRVLLLSAAALAGSAIAVHAQAPITQSDIAGAWSGKTVVSPKDTVSFVLTIPADGKAGTLKLRNGEPIPTRLVTVGGDSAVTDAGPFPSVLKPGQTVSMVRMIGHFKGTTMTGTVMARYATGQIVRGKSDATRQK